MRADVSIYFVLQLHVPISAKTELYGYLKYNIQRHQVLVFKIQFEVYCPALQVKHTKSNYHLLCLHTKVHNPLPRQSLLQILQRLIIIKPKFAYCYRKDKCAHFRQPNTEYQTRYLSSCFIVL